MPTKIFFGLVSLLFAWIMGGYYLNIIHYGRAPVLGLVSFFSLEVLSYLSPPSGLLMLFFTLPIGTGIIDQLSHIGVLTWREFNSLGVDLASGCLFGLSLHFLKHRKALERPQFDFWFSVWQIFVILGCFLGIQRNILQSRAGFSFRGIVFSFLEARALGAREDFFPANAILLNLLAFTLFAIAQVFFKTHQELRAKALKSLTASASFCVLYAALGRIFGFSYSNVWERGIHGLLPDIHSFSAILVGVIAGISFLSLKRKSYTDALPLLVLVPGLYLSNSRTSIALTGLIFFGFCVYFVKNTKFRFFLIGTMGALGSIAFYPKILSSNFFTFENLNKLSSFRLEIYREAIRNWAEFPFFGIGQSTFFRTSSIGDWTSSDYLRRMNGENAHNYALQILTENGIFGLLSFSLFLFSMLRHWRKCEKYEKASFIGFSAFLLTNLYSHTLLIDGFFFLMILLLAIFCEKQEVSIRERMKTRSILGLSFAFALSLFLSFAYEVKKSHSHFLYTKLNPVCGREDSWSDGFYSGYGRFTFKMTEEQIRLRISHPHPRLSSEPLEVHFDFYKDDYHAKQIRRITSHAPYDVYFDTTPWLHAGAALIEVRLSRCYSPDHYGHSIDKRPLGFRRD